MSNADYVLLILTACGLAMAILYHVLIYMEHREDEAKKRKKRRPHRHG